VFIRGFIILTLFEKTKPILKWLVARKQLLKKELGRIFRFLPAKKQSQSKPMTISPRTGAGG